MPNLEELAMFAKLQMASKDNDPVYPVLEYLERGMAPEQALWLTLLYLAFYNLASAVEVFAAYPEPALPELRLALLPTGVERRNLRGGPPKGSMRAAPMHRHLAALLGAHAQHRAFKPWLRGGFNGSAAHNWAVFQTRWQSIWGNGRWSGYKAGEVFQTVHKYPLRAPDMGHAHSSGPRRGLNLFFQGLPKGDRPWEIEALDSISSALRERLDREHGVSLEISELETVLCDFHSLYKGNYYSGKDIDEMQGQLLKSKRPDLMKPVWGARKAALPAHYLGELNGRAGVDRQRLKLYQKGGLIVGR